jgi:hypothetical protein
MGEHLNSVHDRASLDEAAVLIAKFGDAAAVEAATKADAFRNTGNLLLFSRWRQVERAVQLLQLEDIVGEIH